MNGRVYDYNLGRFMSVDPLVHGGSQGINPYSYLMNNPLSGTDPTGYKPEDLTDLDVSTIDDIQVTDKGDIVINTDNGSFKVDSVGGKNVSGAYKGVHDLGSSMMDIGGQGSLAKSDGFSIFGHLASEGAAASTGLVGKIDKDQLGKEEGNSQEVYDEAEKFFKADQSYMGEEVEFEDMYAVSIRSVEDHSKTYAPKLFTTFEEANKYAGTEYGGGYEKVWVNGYHYGGVSTIYRTATFAKNGYTGVERTIQYLAHESKHYNRAKPSQAHKHINSHQYLSFDLASDAAVKRYRNSLRGESQ
ncbi:hypothetical protein OPS25_12315 [Alteromonas ponticola]|uniref:RHS repeat-associated core domain-containing protein n=1 Tax=Alteromonas aquimaris TaxID=2998417 RepID=A0ABT3P942_9ALTE|nr:RHS repeat-associated core domain-containing protein [Alteromonas aquimaris]MCW8109284.1 hypothetical protein [Alteromonas aquimaris]